MRNASSLLLALAITVGGAGCSTTEPEPGPEVSFGTLLEVLGDPIQAATLVSDEPASFLISDVGDLQRAMEFRSAWQERSPAATLNTVFDVSPIGALERAAFGDDLIDSALDGSGRIFLDESGQTAASLRQHHPGTHLVLVGPDRRIRSTQEILPAE